MAPDRRELRWNGWGWNDHSAPSLPENVWTWLAQQLGMRALLATPPRTPGEVELPPSRLSTRDRQVLARLIGADKLREEPLERASHAYGRSYQGLLRLRAGDASGAPDAIVYPRSNQDVLKVLAFASERMMRVAPQGGGALSRDRSHRRGGSYLSLDLTDMDQVESIDAQSRMACVQAGVFGPALERALAERGLTFGHYPRIFEFSTLGGWIATGHARQGATGIAAQSWFDGGEVATPRGMLRNGDFSPEGPQLSDLAAGSRGALGVITSARLRLEPVPTAHAARAYLFSDFAAGTAAIREAIRLGIRSRVLRLSDPDETRFLYGLSRLSKKDSLLERALGTLRRVHRYDAPCLLIAEFAGTRDTVAQADRAMARVARQYGSVSVGVAPAELWLQRRFLAPYFRDAMLDHGLGAETLEITTSWNNLVAVYGAMKTSLREAIGATVPRLAHGIVLCHTSASSSQGISLTFDCIFPRALHDELGQARAIRDAAAKTAVASGASSSQPHGHIGLEILQAIRRTVDPQGILDSGEVAPP